MHDCSRTFFCDLAKLFFFFGWALGSARSRSAGRLNPHVLVRRPAPVTTLGRLFVHLDSRFWMVQGSLLLFKQHRSEKKRTDSDRCVADADTDMT